MHITEVLGKFFLFGMAGVGMAFVTMVGALGIRLLAAQPPRHSLLRRAIAVVMQWSIVVAVSVVFMLLWIFVLYFDREDYAETVVFGSAFVACCAALGLFYFKLTPGLVEWLKSRTAQA